MRLLLPLLLLCFAVPSLPALAQEQADTFSSVEKLAREELNQANIPGAALAIVRGDRLIWAKGIGISNIETKAPVTADMLLRIGSVTKMFTAAAAVSLALDGKLELKRPVAEYVPDLDAALGKTTLHQVLSHTAGLHNDGSASRSCDEEALGRLVRGWRKEQFFTAPGEIYSYSNPGYWLAGYTAEILDKKAYADVLTERLFVPLGMRSTTFRAGVAVTYPLALGHRPSGAALGVVRPLTDTPASWPSGGMFSSVNDLSRWVTALLNHGQLEGKQVLKPEIVTMLTTAHAHVATASAYGYGMAIREYRGVRVWEHGGSSPGYGALIRMFPDQRAGIILLTNRTSGALPKTVEAITELLLSRELKKPDPAAKPLEMTPDELNKYVGRYENGQLKAEIIIKEGRLFGRQAFVEMPLTKVGPDRFLVTLPGSQNPDKVAFVARQDGTAGYLCVSSVCMKRQP